MKSWEKMIFIGSAIAIVLVGCGSIDEANTVTEDTSEEIVVEEVETPAKATNSNDFRFANWKDTQEDVLKSETAQRVQNSFMKNNLLYQTQLNGYNVQVNYYFDTDGLLYKGEYTTVEQFDNESVETCYNSLKDSLTEKYGEPISEGTQSTLTEADWETDTSTIKLIEMKDSCQSCFIYYEFKANTSTDMF